MRGLRARRRGATTAAEAVAAARDRLLGWHDRFTRFDEESELSRVNADPRETVPVSREMACLAQAVLDAARASGGLVDATLLTDIEDAGYRSDLQTSLPLPLALKLAPARRPGAPRPEQAWRTLAVDAGAGTITRPPGVRLDSGGLVKGLAADLIAAQLAGHASFAIDCAGDLRIGGSQPPPRQVNVAGPFDAASLHTFTLERAGIATSGIGRAAGSTSAAVRRITSSTPRRAGRRSPASCRSRRLRRRRWKPRRAARRPSSPVRSRRRSGCRTAAWSSSTTRATSSSIPP